MYSIEFTKTAEKDLRRLPKQVISRIRKAVDALAENPRPHGYKKLVGQQDRYRIRIGDYRIIYNIKDDILVVLVIEIDHRKDIYRP